ncbi:DinB family protein [Paenibacillus sp. HB172176]|uniref:DinB family protein n=1 Tax=Paenibacillus sp. HB172176 TaxID=2493690 RepID=UPI00143A0FB6|nr:DinB family protein [Paenibacillus sp. HB172176]
MRNTAEALQAFETVVERYSIELESFDMERLMKKPNEEDWSIGQMYMHLIQSAQFLHLHNVDQCLAGSEVTVDAAEEKTERGKGAFELGSFPPVRIRVPASPQYTPKQPESKKQLTDGFLRVVERMKRTEAAVSKVPVSRKMVHPGFGALNAQEWFLLIEMHYRHHLSQLERLKNG